MSRLSPFLLAAICVMAPASAAITQPVQTQSPFVTRLVKLYSDYEQRLLEAISRKDAAEIDQLVASDFELRSINNIGVPTPRAEWIAQSLKSPTASVAIRQMAVHDYGNIRVVSFAMSRTKGDHNEPSIAIIDVWMKSGSTSVLKVRYAAVQTTSTRLVPGEIRTQQIEKRY